MSSRRNVLLFFLLFLLVPMLPILKVHGAPATIAVDPLVSNVTIGDTFNININVASIANFTCWELKLYFLRGVLNCTAAIEGPFLKTGGGTYYSKTITNNFNATHGQLLAYSTLLGITSVAGSGTILTVTFKAVGGGNTPLHMADIKLGDEKIPPQPIPYTAIDGTAHVTSGVGHDLAVTAITTSKQGCTPAPTIGRNYTLQINVTVQNQGGYVESFFDVWTELSLGLPPPITVAPAEVASLGTGETVTLTLNWNTTGAAFGNYTVTGVVETVSGETETADNRLNDIYIFVTLPGDFNGDKKVNILDAITLSNSFNAKSGDANWNPNADINCDNKVNILDAILLGNYFNQNWT